MVEAEVLKPFKWQARDGRILSYRPGQRIKAPRERFVELEVRGYVKVLDPDSASPSFPDPVEMISRAIKEVEQFYASGALRWARDQRPDLYWKMRALEREIDQLARARALGILKVRLEQWRELIGKMVRDYLSQNSKERAA